MENQDVPVFEINTEKILAKLHLAGQQQLNAIDKKAIIINTGIENPVEKADPENPGKVNFNLDNKSGEYEFAVLKTLQYQVPIDINKNKDITNLKEELIKTKEKEKLTDKVKDKKSQAYKIQEKILKVLDSFKLKNYKPDPENYDESINEFKEALKIENEERVKIKNDNIEKLKELAFNNIKTYFITVSGEENASKINQEDIAQLDADVKGEIKSPTQFNNIKNFKIEIGNINDEIKKYEDEIQSSNKPSEIINRNIMFVIGFKIEI